MIIRIYERAWRIEVRCAQPAGPCWLSSCSGMSCASGCMFRCTASDPRIQLQICEFSCRNVAPALEIRTCPSPMCVFPERGCEFDRLRDPKVVFLENGASRGFDAGGGPPSSPTHSGDEKHHDSRRKAMMLRFEFGGRLLFV